MEHVYDRRDEMKRAGFLGFALVLLTFGHLLYGQGTYWVPVDPPQSHYRINVRIDPQEGFIRGKETVTLENHSDRTIEVLALDWILSETSSIEIISGGKTVELLNAKQGAWPESPLFYRLPEPAGPEVQIQLDIAFEKTFEVSEEDSDFRSTQWYPRLWWDGLPIHDSFSVKLDIPQGYALAISGRLNEQTGRFEVDGARTFGVCLGKNNTTESREVDGILITALFTEKGAQAASVCLETAADCVKFYKDWLGFYPFEFLYIIPGGRGRWGGYPFATGIVVIHGEETFKEGEPHTHWQRITAHEIGHEYWGEWVLDPDDPAWVWIGMGIFADTEYILARNIDPKRRQGWMGNYINGISKYYDTTVDIPPAILSKIRYDHNNTVIHSKGFSIVSALDSVLGRETFERIYKKCLNAYGGKQLSWRDFQRFFEKESGQNLSWFFEQWVRSNRYLCYKIESQESHREGERYLSSIQVKRLGSMEMPVPVKAIFEDGTEQVKHTNRALEVDVLTFRSKAALRQALLDPEHKLAMVEEPLPEISEEAADLMALGWSFEDSPEVYEKIKEEDIANSSIWYNLGMGCYEFDHFFEAYRCFEKVSEFESEGLTKFAALAWLGLLKDLEGKREQAIGHYKEALKYDTGESMSHGWLRIEMNRDWIEDRLKSPFTSESTVHIPEQPSAEELVQIVDELNWKREGKTPFLIYEKASGLDIDKRSFWFKLGMLLFDSGYYAESFAAFKRVSEMDVSKLYKFTSYTWIGHLKDLEGKREEAIKYYKLALEYDTGDTMQHSQFRMKINRRWVEKRLKTPFTWKH
jgi:tetratricopeptide (TPR) repeat protein